MNREKICIVGLGLMGGSLALGLRNKGFKGRIIGYDKNIEYMEEAKLLGAIDNTPLALEEAIEDADIIILAVPLLHYSDIFEAINKNSKEGAIITDIGSVKKYPDDIARGKIRKTMHFIGGHPMTGSEKSGFNASSPFLYENAYYFLTPGEGIQAWAIEKIKSMVEFLGSYPVIIPPKEHDRIVSRISHLPHLVAMTLVNLIEEEGNLDYLTFIGGGFRDTTRIASGNTKMWKDICTTNKEEIIASIDSFQTLLEKFKTSLKNREDFNIEKSLEMGKSIRDELPRRTKGYITPLFEIVMSVEDKPGILGKITQIIGERDINIKKIEIVNVREGEPGALRMSFDSELDRSLAVELLKSSGMEEIYLREDV